MNKLQNKTYLAIDYGSRRIGLAKTDPMGIIASSLTTLEVKSTKQALQKISDTIEQYNPAALVIGYPLLASGDKSEKCIEIDKFVDLLAEMFGGPIHKIDEQYSSVEAIAVIHAHGEKSGKDKKRIDRLAAVIILQRFLDEQG